jgi:RimJ/RimL family protein N-acetyltransferase
MRTVVAHEARGDRFRCSMGDVVRPDVPPERIELEGMLLRRLTPDDAAVVASAASESMAHLRPWMPWATPQAVSVEAQRDRLLGPAGSWSANGSYEFGAFGSDDGELVAMCGLHRRIGPGALEIGYWVHVRHTRRGIATACARALTSAGFGLRGVERMEIHCDAANVASAAVAARLGYRLDSIDEHEPEAPGEVGQRLAWVVYRAEWDRVSSDRR